MKRHQVVIIVDLLSGMGEHPHPHWSRGVWDAAETGLGVLTVEPRSRRERGDQAAPSVAWQISSSAVCCVIPRNEKFGGDY